jgi:hypothetical protein
MQATTALNSKIARLCRVIFLCLLAAAIVSGQPQKHEEDGREKTTWSGRSYAAKTLVAKEPQISAVAPGFDAERVWSGEDDWEPAIAADPSSPFVYQMTTRYSGPSPCKGCPLPLMIFRSSSDSGATWAADRFLQVTKKKQNDPQVEVAADGSVYVVWLDEYNPGIKFIKSSNRGATWSTPISFTGKGRKPNWSDKPVLAVSSNGQHVYIAFNASDSYVVASHDYGLTFSAPVKTNNDTRYWFHSAGAVSLNGDVYFAAADYSQDYTGNAHINVQKSSDGGLSWTTTRVDTSSEMPDCPWAEGCYFGFLGPSIGLAIDGTGRIMVAYNAGNSPGAPQALYVRTSFDGINWSSRQEVSNGASNVNNAFPALASGPSGGDFRLVWQDDRNASNTGWNTWYRRTTNGGGSWNTSLRISDLSSGAPYKNSAGYKFPYGDYLEIAVDSLGRNHIIWGEGDSYTGPGGTWYTRGQ